MSQDTVNWPIVVILDHPLLPEVDLGFTEGVVWLTYNDWLELQRHKVS